MKRVTALLARVAIAGTALIAVACGGGGGGNTAASETELEDRAASSWPGMLQFALRQIAALTTDTAEPRAVGGIVAPQADTDEPAAL